MGEEKGNTGDFNRRNFLRAVGGTAGVSTLGVTTTVVRGDSGKQHLNISRWEATEEESQPIIKAALESDEVNAIVAELPGDREGLNASASEAFVITARGADNTQFEGEQEEYTQVLIPVQGAETDIVFAESTTSEEKNSAGIKLRNGMDIGVKRTRSGSLERTKWRDAGEQRGQAIAAIQRNQGYQQYKRENASKYNIREDQAAVSVDESGKSYAAIPADSTDSDEDSMIFAELDSSGEVISIQSSGWDCFINCAVLRTGLFAGYCWTLGCSLCRSIPNQATCSPCAVCLGVVGATCAAQCAVSIS